MGGLFNVLVTASLRNRLFVLIMAAVLVGYGGYELTRLPVDVFPDLNRPTVTLLDLGLPPRPNDPDEGLAALSEFLALDPQAKVIVVSGQGDKQNALRAVGTNILIELVTAFTIIAAWAVTILFLDVT